jgi:hypothetical protein
MSVLGYLELCEEPESVRVWIFVNVGVVLVMVGGGYAGSSLIEV